MIRDILLQKFKDDLWKDQRQLTIINQNGRPSALIKHYQSPAEAACEQQVLRHLADVLGADVVPELIESSNTTSTIRYIFGIRLFNLLVDLDYAPAETAPLASKIKAILVNRCIARERQLQNALLALPGGVTRSPYPIEKARSIISILADCVGIRWDEQAIDNELKWMTDVWQTSVCVPFRDATSKNIVLASPQLWLGNFESEDSRREHLYESIRKGTWRRWSEDPIIDYDFCSCIHNTTPEDDVISIKYHERTWMSPPRDATEVVWDFTPDAKRAAISFFVRYYRFGGRKAAYRLLHPTGHRVRFRHDRDTFYFQALPGIMKTLWPEVTSQLVGLLEFTEVLGRHLPTARPDFDYFRAVHPTAKRDYYVDMYPE